LSAVHVHLWTAAALQAYKGPGGGHAEEPDTSDARFSRQQNNAVVEENNFTDLGKRKKLERQLTRSENT